MTPPITPSRLRCLLLVNWGIVTALGLTGELYRNLAEFGKIPSWPKILSLSFEGNFPNWYSSGVLFCAAILVAWNAIEERRRGGRHLLNWWCLSAVFFYISLDESISIHEHMNEWFDFKGALTFGWIIPAAVFLLVFGLSYVKFLIHLPRTTRIGFLIAGSIYVSGALGIEIPLGMWVTNTGSDDNLGYALIDSVGESMEVLGTSFFVVALLRHLIERTGAALPGIAAALHSLRN